MMHAEQHFLGATLNYAQPSQTTHEKCVVQWHTTHTSQLWS